MCTVRAARALSGNNQPTTMDASGTQAQGAPTAWRRLQLRYPGGCIRCGKQLVKGIDALYDAATRTVRCTECVSTQKHGATWPDDSGVAGSSAQREFDRRHAAREERVRRRLGNTLGHLALAISDDPQSTRAWARGAHGEQQL